LPFCGLSVLDEVESLAVEEVFEEDETLDEDGVFDGLSFSARASVGGSSPAYTSSAGTRNRSLLTSVTSERGDSTVSSTAGGGL